MAIDCIARARIPTATWSMPVAAQNRITRSCALSFVVADARRYGIHFDLLSSGAQQMKGRRVCAA
jgi:hypothetical protein